MTVEVGEAWERLRFQLDMHDGFWFGLVVADDPDARVALRGRAESWCDAEGVPFVLYRRAPSDLRELARALASDRKPGIRWVVVDGPGADRSEWEAGAATLLIAMNEQRDALRRGMRAGVVFEGADRLKTLLRTVAPDLFSVRAFVVEPGRLASSVAGSSLDGLVEDAIPTEERPEPWAWELRLEPFRTPASSSPPLYLLEEARRYEGRGEEGARRSHLGALARGVEALLVQGWITEAADPVDEMLDLAGELAAAWPGDRWVASERAWALEASGEVARARGDLITAREAWLACVRERERLIATGMDPDAPDAPWRDALEAGLGWAAVPADVVNRLEDLARAWDRLGQLEWSMGGREAAAAALEESRELRERALSLGGWRRDRMAALALTLSLQGELALRSADLDRARALLDEAVDIRRDLWRREPENSLYKRYLSVSCGRLGQVLLEQGDLDGALVAQGEAVRLSGELVERDQGSAVWSMDHSIAWSRLGDVHRASGELQAAEGAYRQALPVRRQLAEGDPENARWQAWLAVGLCRVAEMDRLQGRLDDAEALAREALELSEHVVDHAPADEGARRGLAATELLVARIAAARADLDAARAAAQRAVDLRAALAAARPEDPRLARELAQAQALLGALAP